MDFSNLKSLKSCSLEEVKERLGASKKKQNSMLVKLIQMSLRNFNFHLKLKSTSR